MTLRHNVGVTLEMIKWEHSAAPIGAVVEQDLTQPFMFLMSEHGQGGDTGAEGRLVGDDIRSIYSRLPSDYRTWITIHGANHFGFSDDGALLKSPFLTTVLHRIGIIPLDGRRQLRITPHCISTFFDVHLRGAPASDIYYPAGIFRD